MSRFYSYINTAKTILSLYKGDIPFSTFLKNYFAKEKKYGSRDRRMISSLCYNYFRIGTALSNTTIEERLLTGLFLCNDVPNEILQNEKPEWNKKINSTLPEKILIAGIDVEAIFSFTDELSESIDINAFCASFLIQPKLFIRLRPGKQIIVKNKLIAAKIDFEEISNNCLALANGTKLEEVAIINREAVIQDMNSQKAGELMTAANSDAPANVWDCCAASGGKSIMACDILSHINLMVSDIRQSILHNLQKRFKEAEIKDYNSFIADLTNYKNIHKNLGDKKFDVIICDAPCSGSGTWSRTPEQLTFFNKDEITKYNNLQRSICTNTIPFLKKGGYFLYITCSVFKSENEDIVESIKQKLPLTLVKMELLKGYEMKADTMFAALFRFD
jgi:16S rRNA (cytosine967-C5)-methyltransferase